MATAEDQLFSRFGREFPAGTILFEEGQPGRELYVVHSGLVQTYKRVRDVEKVLSRVGPGDFFGEMALLSHRPHNVSAAVVEDARLLVIDPRTFEAMIRGNMEIAVRLIRKLAQRLESAEEQIETLLLRDPASRVAHLLWRSAERAAGGEGSALVQLGVRELPSQLGLRADQIDDVLARLSKAKLVSMTADGLQVPDIAKLRQYLDYLEMKERFGDV